MILTMSRQKKYIFRQAVRTIFSSLAEITGGFQARFRGFFCLAAWSALARSLFLKKLRFVSFMQGHLKLVFKSTCGDFPADNAAGAWSNGSDVVQETL